MAGTNPSTAPTTTSRIGGLQVGIIVLTLATAAIHFWMASKFPEMRTIFMLNGIGYLGLLGVLYLPLGFLAPIHNLARWALIAYTAVTIVAFFYVTLSNGWSLWDDPIGLVTKAIEVVLIVLLFMDAKT